MTRCMCPGVWRSITDRSATQLFEYDRAVFLRTAASQTTYKVAAPWTP